MKRQEASYTVELSLLMPVLLLVLFAPVYAGYELYGQAQRASACCWDEAFDAAEKVRAIKFAEDAVWEE